MLAQLDDYDWAQVFADENAGNVSKDTEAFGCSAEPPPCREDVVEIIGMATDGQDEPSFAGLFRLKDGRFLAACGNHDYTGWD